MTTKIERGRADLIAWNASRSENFFSDDDDLLATLRTRLGPERLVRERALFERVGALAAGDVSRFGRESNLDENLPRLERYDGVGTRTEEVVFHPSYHSSGRAIWG